MVFRPGRDFQPGLNLDYLAFGDAELAARVAPSTGHAILGRNQFACLAVIVIVVDIRI